MASTTEAQVTPEKELAEVLTEIDRRNLEKNFRAFFTQAWKVLNPYTPLNECRYVDAIAEYLQAVHTGQIRRLIINQPPRTGKSSLVSICFPCWIWTTVPGRKFVFYSYSYDKLSVPFSVQRRRLIQSAWYQGWWAGRFYLSYDENMKWFFSNSKTGHMAVLTGATGVGGNCLIIDDPHSVEEALSDTERKAGVTQVREGLMSRLDNPDQDAVIIVMQRLHEEDVTGSFLKDGNWTNLWLQAEAERKTTISMPISQRKWKREAGDMLDPLRLSNRVLNEKKLELGARGFQGQYQQEPAPATGTIFKTDWWRWWKNLPELDETVISVDCAFKGKETSDDVAIHAWGLSGINSYLLARDTRKMGFAATKAAIRAMTKALGATIVLIEDKANGSAIIEELQTEFFVIAIDPGFGDKVARAEGCSPMVEAGTVYLPEAADAQGVVGTGVKIQTLAAKFPAAAKDDIDAMTQFLNWRRKRGGSMEWFKQMAKKAEEQTAQRMQPQEPSGNGHEHPTPQQIHKLAMEQAGMKTTKSQFTKPVKAGELKKDSGPQECEVCHSTALSRSSRGCRCNSCGHAMPGPSREVNIG